MPASGELETGRWERKGEKEKRRICPETSPTWISNPCNLDARIHPEPIKTRNHHPSQPPENWRWGRKGEMEKRRIFPNISPTWISNPCDLDARIYLEDITKKAVRIFRYVRLFLFSAGF
jgi:hypothetical protein